MAKNKPEPVEIVPSGQTFVEPLEKVLHYSMLPYAEHVILDRALPRVEDGLKPVQRRILYTMNEMGLTPDKPHKKSARIVGECMGKFHPHGDSSVYDAMVRLAQDFNMGKTLVDGHGNFGSVDGDGAAAMRYTEARLQPLALELLRDIDKETVSFSLNFDDSLKEPDVLPGRFPNLLVNGSSGIAVGLATNIPTHNLGEVINGVVAYIDNPAISLEEMMEHIPCPDFSTGGIIIANELLQAYKTGRGKIAIRAKINLEKAENGKTNLVITELPYQVNKANLLRKIEELRFEKKEEFAAIDQVQDESDRTGMRAVIRVKRDADIGALLKLLVKYTELEVTFGINMVVIADGKPQQLGLLDIIRHYVKYQREVVLKRTQFELKQAEQRCHILEGLIVAVQNIDEVIAIIKKSESTSDARNKLMERFTLTEVQAQAILDLRLARLTKLEVFKLEEELKALQKRIKRLRAITKSKDLQLEVVKEEILEIKAAYPSPRKSRLVFTQEEANELLSCPTVPKKAVSCTFVYTADDKFKLLTDKQRDALQKPLDGKYKANQVPTAFVNTSTDKTVLAFTNFGYCHRISLDEMDVGGKLTDKGATLAELSPEALKNEKVVALFAVGERLPIGNLVFFTKKGMVKKSEWSEYDVKKAAFEGIKLVENDELLAVEEETSEEDTLMFVTEQGSCLRAKNEGITPKGRVSMGVRGISLREGDNVVYAAQIDEEGEIAVVTDEGKFKKVIISLIKVTGRDNKGATIVDMKDGARVIFATHAKEGDMVAVVDKAGNVSELSADWIPVTMQSAKARRIPAYEEGTVKSVLSMICKKGK